MTYIPPKRDIPLVEPTGDLVRDLAALMKSWTHDIARLGELKNTPCLNPDALFAHQLGISMALNDVTECLMAASKNSKQDEETGLTPCEQLVMSVAIHHLCTTEPLMRANLTTALPFWLDKLRNANTIAPMTATPI